MDREIRRPLSRLISAAALVMTACSHAARSEDPTADGLAELRNATRAYQQLDAAVAAGYPRAVADCIVHEHHGAMGYHHLNRAYVDKVVDVQRPEILLYERKPDGSYKLNGVEFIVPYRFWPRDSVAPVLWGRSFKQEDNFKYWYMHVWAWSANADGVFADFNPDVQCAENRKVYKPTS